MFDFREKGTEADRPDDSSVITNQRFYKSLFPKFNSVKILNGMNGGLKIQSTRFSQANCGTFIVMPYRHMLIEANYATVISFYLI